MANIKKRDERAVVPTEEMVRENVSTAIAQYPQLVSFDSTDPDNEMIMLRCQVEQGIAAQLRDGWRANIVHWMPCVSQIPNEHTGELEAVACLVLIADNGELCRLHGWPAINSWLRLVNAASKERCLKGIKVRVKRVPTSTAGRSCWNVLPDA